MKRNLLYITAILLFSVILLISFQFLTKDPNKNGFNRKIRQVSFSQIKIYSLPAPYFYFAGPSQDKLYLKDLKNDSTLFTINEDLLALKTYNLSAKKDSTRKKRKVDIGILEAHIYVTNSSRDLSIFERKTVKVYNLVYPGLSIRQTNLLSRQSIVGRQITRQDGKFEKSLIKINYTDHYKDQKNYKIYKLEKQQDGFFSTDGILLSDPSSSKLFYQYFYRGEFLCLDTNLRLLYKGKTIDTVTKAQIKVASLDNDAQRNTITLASPPKAVNRNFTFYQDDLYIMSALKADNEKERNFRKNQVVDVYAMNNGLYLYSFYIPRYMGKKLREFRIKGNYLFAIFGNLMIKYKFKMH